VNLRSCTLVALLALSGCQAIPPAMVVGIGGILTGGAALTNADVSAAEAYVNWRKSQTVPVTGMVTP
jgi:hypothetical protein